MLGDLSNLEHIYLACGYTDMRKSIDGLAAMVQQLFQLDPFSNSLFLFAGVGAIGSKRSPGRKTALFFSINTWKVLRFSGRRQSAASLAHGGIGHQTAKSSQKSGSSPNDNL